MCGMVLKYDWQGDLNTLNRKGQNYRLYSGIDTSHLNAKLRKFQEKNHYSK